jgi:tetratricopeptide (TPR) repeat protein
LSYFLSNLKSNSVLNKLLKISLSVLAISAATCVSNPAIAQVSEFKESKSESKLDTTELITRGKKLWDAQDINGALTAYRQAATTAPNNARIHASIGFLLTQQGNFAEAIAAFERATTLDKNDPKPLIALGFVYTQQQRFPEALQAYRNAVRLDPRNVDAYLSIGYVLTQQRDFFGAVAVYRQIITLIPNSIKAYLNLGYLFQQKGNLDEALTTYLNADRLDPNNLDVLVALASVNESKNNPQETTEIYRRILAIDPRHFKANMAIALIARDRGDFDEAMTAYRRAATGQIDAETSAQIRRAIAALYLRQNNISGAIVSYREILARNPEDASAHFALGKLLLEQLRKPEAIQSFKQAERIFANKGDIKSLTEVKKALELARGN